MTLRNCLAALFALSVLAGNPVRAQTDDAPPQHFSAEDIKARRHAGDQAYMAGDYAEAMRQFMPLAEAGDAYSQNDVATLYQDGQGVAPDEVKAAKWYQLAADQGLATAENTLAVMYDQGQGVTVDHAKALDLLQRAAAHGDEYAQYNLATRYLNGDGVPQDYVQAVMWLEKSAEKRFPGAELQLGNLVKDGHGIAQDDYTAYVWYTRAVRDAPRAYYERDRKWFRQTAEAARSKLAAQLTPEQIASAENE